MITNHFNALLLAGCLCLFSLTEVSAQLQTLPLQTLPLDNLNSFRPVAGNWSIASDVLMDRNQEKTMKTTSGKGVLVNIPTDKNRGNLFTTWEHGDMELEFDCMMAPGSNAGVYLQGRYEIQLSDSWGVKTPTSLDCGAISERWDDSKPEGQKGYEGHPPLMDASRAPGLWQHFRMVFQAPRFNSQGIKATNARMVKVVQNGILIHENIELLGSTRFSPFTDEKLLGPLMFQGDQGKVAIRHIRYKCFEPALMVLKDIQYQYYEGEYEKIPDLKKLKPVRSGSTEAISWELGKSPNDFAFRYTGQMNVMQAGNYLFNLQSAGASRLIVAGKTVIDHDGAHHRDEVNSGQIELPAGQQAFTLIYAKHNPWQAPALGFFVEGPSLASQSLHLPSSFPYLNPVGAIRVVPGRKPRVIRGFLEHNGKKKTHCASVGDPSGVHYSIDMSQGTVLQVWKGEFLDATSMWYERGEPQLGQALGSAIILSSKPSLAVLTDKNTPWPDTLSTEANYLFKGYSLNKEGRPTFKYSLSGVEVLDYLYPEEDRKLSRKITLKGDNRSHLWYRLAEGQIITQLPDGTYAINDNEYYLDARGTTGAKTVIRESATKEGTSRQELLVSLSATTTLQYSLIW
jgi:hypothetical protein